MRQSKRTIWIDVLVLKPPSENPGATNKHPRRMAFPENVHILCNKDV